MVTKKKLPTLEDLKSSIRHVDLSRLENRLVGKPLVELEHCLVECLGELQYVHKGFQEAIAEQTSNCLNADSLESFLYSHKQLRHEKSEFGREYGPGSLVDNYFSALRDRLIEREEKQIDNSPSHSFPSIVPLTHARMLTTMVCNELNSMWSSASGENKQVNQLWDHWMSK